MSKGFLFWVLWLFCFISGFGWWRGYDWGMWGLGGFCLAMLFLLGWHNFGFVVH